MLRSLGGGGGGVRRRSRFNPRQKRIMRWMRRQRSLEEEMIMRRDNSKTILVART